MCWQGKPRRILGGITDRPGYLTVYMALSLLVLLSLFFALLEGVRQNAVCLEGSLIVDVGLDSALAEYHQELFKQYNLFYIDTSYGSAQPSIETVERHVLDYITRNCETNEVLLGDWLYRDFLALQPGEVRIVRALAATDSSGAWFRRNAIEAVRDDVGLTYLQSLASWIQTVEEKDLEERDLASEKRKAEEEIRDYGVNSLEVGEGWLDLEEDAAAPSVTAPSQEMPDGKGILGLVMDAKALSGLSPVSVDVGSLASTRRRQGKLGSGNWVAPEEESLLDKLLFVEYIFRYCGNYRSPLDKGVLRYQAEYVAAGKTSDLENLKAVANRISAIRWVADLLTLYSDKEKCELVAGVCDLAASLVLLPEIAPLLQTVVLLGWSYAEALYDVKCLLSGGKVPLIKGKDAWHYDMDAFLEGILGGSDESMGNKEEGGLGYGDYLRILVFMAPKEEQTFRLMDVVEMDIRQTQGNGAFRLDGCIDRFEAEASVVSSYGYSYFARKKKSYW